MKNDGRHNYKMPDYYSYNKLFSYLKAVAGSMSFIL